MTNDCEKIKNEIDEEWLSAIAKQWVRIFGQKFAVLDGETREEGLEQNVFKVFAEIDQLLADLAALRLKNNSLWDEHKTLIERTSKLEAAHDDYERTNASFQQELSLLRTPHCCGECEWCSISHKRCHNRSVGVELVLPHTPWLCGHFKAKGTK